MVFETLLIGLLLALAYTEATKISPGGTSSFPATWPCTSISPSGSRRRSPSRGFRSSPTGSFPAVSSFSAGGDSFS